MYMWSLGSLLYVFRRALQSFRMSLSVMKALVKSPVKKSCNLIISPRLHCQSAMSIIYHMNSLILIDDVMTTDDEDLEARRQDVMTKPIDFVKLCQL